MLYSYARNSAIARVLTGPGMSLLGEPRLDRRGALTWRFEGERIADLNEVVPSFSDVGSPDLTCRFVVCAKSMSGETSEVQLDWIGVTRDESRSAEQSGPLTLDVDTVKIGSPLSLLEIRLEFRGDLRPSRDAVVGISLRGPHDPVPHERVLAEGELMVPPMSQFEQSASIGHRICSPTSLAMVLTYYGYAVSPLELAELSYAAKHDLYGVWPQNIWAASKIGAPGCLMHIESWNTVDHLFRLDVPIIASIRYRRGELRGAAFTREDDELTGHLVVVRGNRDGTILVNDPGARSVVDVSRVYDRGEFARVWFERSAMAYIVLPPKVLRSERNK